MEWDVINNPTFTHTSVVDFSDDNVVIIIDGGVGDDQIVFTASVDADVHFEIRGNAGADSVNILPGGQIGSLDMAVRDTEFVEEENMIAAQVPLRLVGSPGGRIRPEFGDINQDGLIDSGDVSKLEERKLEPPEYFFVDESEFVGASVRVFSADLNNDGFVDDSDFAELIDAIFGVINGTVPYYHALDVNGDNSITAEDIDFFLRHDVSGNSVTGDMFDTYHGDANLDGRVDAIDVSAVGDNWLLPADSWADGDFNGDGMVDVLDLNIVGINWQNGVLGEQGAIPDVIDFPGLTNFGMTYAPADVNLDGSVDALDMEVITASYLTPPADVNWTTGDVNGDGSVTWSDINVFMTNRNGSYYEGDFDLSGVVTVNDIDILFAAIWVDSQMSSYGTYLLGYNYDLDYDGVIDDDDMDYLIHSVLGTEYGDANLDGMVDQTDLDIVNANWQQSVDSWADGDFNGDGFVDITDFFIVVINLGFGT